ncbi:YslB family protein [Aquibacillus sp. 3ASR75-11]|uniref:YslB family protein n=1 Tax=Terrihalobacillus insolitus TaxID=2950438 RepID=A0A9X3WSA6_9BACI|nr:YslB family protein [Terrihalobacillus insolitus]MDC3412577.1 YslB family protein [Terrihalobacillus insolitus]MDC3423928.1 YslB family protein [Terrihalobacillus insolitus]
MERKIEKLEENIVHQLHTAGAGYDILRHISLPDLLGKDASTILYTMGKNLARRLQYTQLEDVQAFFKQAGWGTLTQVKEKRRETIFELTGDALSRQLRLQVGTEYRFEAGFLAESFQTIKDIACECMDESKPKKQSVQFSVIYTK